MSKPETFTYELTREQVTQLINGQDTIVRVIAGQMQQGGLQVVEDGTKKQTAALEMAAIMSKPLIEADKKKAKAPPAEPVNRHERRAVAKKGK